MWRYKTTTSTTLLTVAETCCQVFNFTDLIHVVSLTVINCYIHNFQQFGDIYMTSDNSQMKKNHPGLEVNTDITPEFLLYLIVKVKVILQQAEVAQGVPGRLRPRIFLDVWHYKGGRSSAIRTGRLYPRRNPWYSFSEAESTPGHMVFSVGATEKIPSDTTRNWSRDHPNSSAVP